MRRARLQTETFRMPRYKGSGENKLDDGSPDCVEFYSFGQHHLLGPSSPDYPALIQANRKTLEDFLHHAHGIISHLLSHLDKHLALQPNTLAGLIPLKTRPQAPRSACSKACPNPSATESTWPATRTSAP